MQDHTLEIALHWAATGLYGVSAVLVTFAVVFDRRRLVRWALAVATLGLLPHGAAILAHWLEVGHGPYHTRYEILTSTSWTAIAVLVALVWRHPAWAALAIVGFPVALLGQGLGLFSGPTAPQMPPALKSVWLVYHILFAKLAAGSFLVSGASGVVMLLRARPRPGSWLERTPPAPVLDALAVRAAGFGLIFWTVTMAAGSIWGNDTWGRYWGWDPIETWALVSWLAYGSFLHARLFLKLRPVPTAWFAIGCFAFFVFAFLVIPTIVTSLHNVAFV